MIEVKAIDPNDINPLLVKETPKEEHEAKVIESATLKITDPDKFKTCHILNVTDITNDGTDFSFEVDTGNIGTIVRIPRDLLKQLIYDIYLK